MSPSVRFHLRNILHLIVDVTLIQHATGPLHTIARWRMPPIAEGVISTCIPLEMVSQAHLRNRRCIFVYIPQLTSVMWNQKSSSASLLISGHNYKLQLVPLLNQSLLNSSTHSTNLVFARRIHSFYFNTQEPSILLL